MNFGRSRSLRLLALAGAFLLGIHGSLQALSFDARKIAMGGTLLPFHSESYILNPAYLDIEEESPLNIPIPLGLFAFLADIPSFDPENENFDAVKLANLLLNPPFYLELVDLSKRDPTNIFIDVAQNNLTVDMDNLRQFMPIGSVETGLFDIRQPRWRYKLRGIHLGVSPFLLMDGDFSYSKNFEQALTDAVPFAPNSDYSTTQHGTVNAGLAINVGRVFDLQDFLSLPKEPRVLAGVNAKYLMGFAYGDIQNTTNIHTFDPIFDDQAPPKLTMNSQVDYAVPEGGDVGPKGSGVGFDVGLLLRFRTMDVGFGIQDLYTRMNWRATREEFAYNDSTNDLDRQVIFEDRTIHADIPRTFSFSAVYRSRPDNGWGTHSEVGDYFIASNLEVAAGDVSVHLGGETYYGPGPIALRLGTFNQGGKMQVSFGAGIPVKLFNFDIALATHSSSFQRKRGVTLATSISFP